MKKIDKSSLHYKVYVEKNWSDENNFGKNESENRKI